MSILESTEDGAAAREFFQSLHGELPYLSDEERQPACEVLAALMADDLDAGEEAEVIGWLVDYAQMEDGERIPLLLVSRPVDFRAIFDKARELRSRVEDW